MAPDGPAPAAREPAPAVREIETPHGPARVHVHAAAGRSGPRGALVLGHGAGGSVTAPDLLAVAAAAVGAGITTVLVEQPYRVAGRRSAAPAHQLDTAWIAILAALRAPASPCAHGDPPAPAGPLAPVAGELAGLPVVTGGRSSGARVACRTAAAVGARGVLCLAFPLQPARRPPRPPAASRLPELAAVAVPVLVVQGTRDPFGLPPADPAARRTVVEVAGDHALRGDRAAVVAAVLAWLPQRFAI